MAWLYRRTDIRLRRTRAAPSGGGGRKGPLPPAAARRARPQVLRFYGPDNVRVMSDAFEVGCRMLPAGLRRNESLRRRIALHILRDLETGERDPTRLAIAAVFSLQF